ncbi:MAG: DJ-1/PfpI family protein [Lentisphaeraceae bacterium]|nr:DJ-1/PfpI family protein [Lentisphaeraceae bacterium]
MKALVLFAEGFEEIEAITPVDVLRRANIEVITAGLSDLKVTGSHGISIAVDKLLDDVISREDFDILILPGGLPGSHYLRDDGRVIDLIRHMNAQEKLIAAICAAPVALEEAGILKNKKVTSHPSKESELKSAEYTAKRVQIDGRIISAKGAGCAMEFSLVILREMGLKQEAHKLAEAMIVQC